MPTRRESDKEEGQWSLQAWRVLEVFVAETVGTALLLFFGCMGQIVWQPQDPINPLQGAIVFAVVVATIIQIFGHITAAHLNPAVTIAFLMLGHINPAVAIVYVISECIGAVVGYGLLLLLTPRFVLNQSPSSLCCTVPHSGLSDLQAVAVEFLATTLLILVICACTDARNADKADSTPLKFGCVILALGVAAGPYTGASMNPARTLGPALWAGNWSSHWVYWLAPCLSGFFTPLFYQAIFTRLKDDDSSVLEEVPLHQIKVNAKRTDHKEKDNSSRST